MKLTRRVLLKNIGAAALAFSGLPWLACQSSRPARRGTGGCAPRPAGLLTKAGGVGKRVKTGNSGNRTKVILVRDNRVMDGAGKVKKSILKKMVEAALLNLAYVNSVEKAWRKYFREDDVVALKVNCLSGKNLSTHPELAEVIAEGLKLAGVPERNIIIYDRTNYDLISAGFSINTSGSDVRCYGSDWYGYDAEPTVVKSVGSCFSGIVSEECTGIVNLPVLKDHDMTGVTISLKNHLGSINNPNKLHTNQGNPYIADLNCASFIKDKQRLIICDALVVCFDGGPAHYDPRSVTRYNALLVSTDPVALDYRGWKIIEELRKAQHLKSLAEEGREPKYIATAADSAHRLGTAEPSRIELVELKLG